MTCFRVHTLIADRSLLVGNTGDPVLHCICQLGLLLSIDGVVMLTPDGWAVQKLSRKMVHLLAGPGFVLTWPLFRCAFSHSSCTVMGRRT